METSSELEFFQLKLWRAVILSQPRRGSHTRMNAGDPCRCSSGGATGRYKETKFYRVGKGVGVAHSTDCISWRAEAWEREGAILLSSLRRREVLVAMKRVPVLATMFPTQ